MKDKEIKEHVLSVRVRESDLKALKRISELNHEKPPETARRALEMLIRAYEGVLKSEEETKKGTE